MDIQLKTESYKNNKVFSDEVSTFMRNEAAKAVFSLLGDIDITCKTKDGLIYVNDLLSMNELLLIDNTVTKYECKFKLMPSRRYTVILITNYKTKTT